MNGGNRHEEYIYDTGNEPWADIVNEQISNPNIIMGLSKPKWQYDKKMTGSQAKYNQLSSLLDVLNMNLPLDMFMFQGFTTLT